MTRKTLAWALGIFLLAAAFTAVGYHEATRSRSADDDRLLVIVSIAPQLEFAERVGGDLVRVTAMVPPGRDPHGYEPTSSQMRDVSDADVYFSVGSGLEFEKVWMDRLVRQNSEMLVVDGAKGVELIDFDGERFEVHGEEDGEGVEDEAHEDDGGDDHDHTGADPHIWMSLRNAVIMVENLRDGLMAADTGNAGEYIDNADAYIAELQALDSETTRDLEDHAGEAFLVYHPAFGYFAHDYGLVQRAIEEDGKEPGSAGLAAVIDHAKDEGIGVVFVEPQFPQQSAETIRKEIDGEVITMNSLPERYLENMEDVSSKLVSALSHS